MSHYAWVMWLAAPAGTTALVAIWTWWRGRAVKPLKAPQAIAAHRAYLDALTHRPIGAGSED